LPGYDMLRELYVLSNPHNGQFPALVAAIRPRLYGRALFPCELEKFELRPDDRVLLNVEARLQRVLPLASWDASAPRVWESGAIQLRAPSPGARLPSPE